MRDGYPFHVWPDGDHAPNDGCPDEQDIECGQRQVPHAKLNLREEQIGGEVDREGESHNSRYLSPSPLHKHCAEADEDDRIDDLPDGADRLRGRRPSWFSEAVVPVNPFIHVYRYRGRVEGVDRFWLTLLPRMQCNRV